MRREALVTEATLFTAGHGFYQFAVSRGAFDRSLYLNLLLQPKLAIPDHYLLHGKWLGEHLALYPSRDSWLEVGLRGGFITPFFRYEEASLEDSLSRMQEGDRRGFDPAASEIAKRLDRTPFSRELWSSPENSANFANVSTQYLAGPMPPMYLELEVDPDDYLGFWARSREWVPDELRTAQERSSEQLGGEGLLLSKMIQVSGERLLGPTCGRIDSVDNLIRRVRDGVGVSAAKDLEVYYSIAAELYNRSLADTLRLAPNSPRWKPYVAALDLWREDLLDTGHEDGKDHDPTIDIEIRLPRPKHLRHVSGDVLRSIRMSATAERYFESLSAWRGDPQNPVIREEMVESLKRYSQTIRSLVGKEVGMFGLAPKFISNATDISRVLEKAPSVLQGFLAVGGTAATAGAAVGAASPTVPAALFSLFVLQTVAKTRIPTYKVDLSISPQAGLRVFPDITIGHG